MDFLLKILAYIIFVLGSLYFFFGGSYPAEKPRKNFGIVMIISILILSYYYWFPN